MLAVTTGKVAYQTGQMMRQMMGRMASRDVAHEHCGRVCFGTTLGSKAVVSSADPVLQYNCLVGIAFISFDPSAYMA